MKVIDYFKNVDINNTLLIGFYGGGNFGDELLLEVLLNLYKKYKAENLKVFFLNKVNYDTYHKRILGYEIITDKLKLLYALIFKTKNIAIGGGGLWGLDFNNNILLLSIIMFISKFVLRKKIYVLGIGYYNSTPRIGRFSATLVALSADLIIARDIETLINFQKFSCMVSLDKDIVFNFSELSNENYTQDVKILANKLVLKEKLIFITVRRFKGARYNSYYIAIKEVIKNNPDKFFILCLFESKAINTEGFHFFDEISKTYKNVSLFDFDYNPLALLFLFKENSEKILLISPQLHGQIVAHLTGVKFLPISYDNKIVEFFNSIGITDYHEIGSISSSNIQSYIKSEYV